MYRTRRVYPCLFLWLLLAWGSSAIAIELTDAQRIELLSEAMRSFDQGAAVRQSNPAAAAASFREAASKFQLIVDSGVRNGKLYYNLGNAYLECGQLGQAILNYRRAQTLMPEDGRLESNLAYARTLCQDQIQRSSQRAFLETLFFWHYATSLRSRYVVFLAFYVLFWLLMIARNYVRRFRWRHVLLPCLLLWMATGISLAADMAAQSHTRRGVIVAEEVVARKGNGEGFEPQFKQKLHEGVEFVVIEQRRDWLHIELPDGKTGWIRTREAGLI